MKKITIKNIYVGQEKNYTKKTKEYESSYEKSLVEGKIFASKTGLEGDNQSDRENHGGIEKAICIFPKSYYDYFKEAHNIELPSCAMGENLTIEGAEDVDFCIGDLYECGEAIFEVSQPRQPCWKISSILNIKNLTALIVKESKSGFYLRVVKEGFIDSSCELKLIKRVHEDINIEFINQCSYKAKDNQENIKKILECSELSREYSESLVKRYKEKDSGIEEWQKDI